MAQASAVALLDLPVVTVGDRFPSMPTGIPAPHLPLPKAVEVFRFAGPMFLGVTREMLDAVRRSGGKPQIVIARFAQVSPLT